MIPQVKALQSLYECLYLSNELNSKGVKNRICWEKGRNKVRFLVATDQQQLYLIPEENKDVEVLSYRISKHISKWNCYELDRKTYSLITDYLNKIKNEMIKLKGRYNDCLDITDHILFFPRIYRVFSALDKAILKISTTQEKLESLAKTFEERWKLQLIQEKILWTELIVSLKKIKKDPASTHDISKISSYLERSKKIRNSIERLWNVDWREDFDFQRERLLFLYAAKRNSITKNIKN